MLKTIRNGVLFGFGFCIACTISFFLVDFISREYWGNLGQEHQYISLKSGVDYSILNKSHRIKTDSLGSRSLYIVGEISIEKKMTKPLIELVALLRDEAGGFIDRCRERIEPENTEKFSFKIQCPDISEEKQFQTYKLELAYLESV